MKHYINKHSQLTQGHKVPETDLCKVLPISSVMSCSVPKTTPLALHAVVLGLGVCIMMAAGEKKDDNQGF